MASLSSKTPISVHLFLPVVVRKVLYAMWSQCVHIWGIFLKLIYVFPTTVFARPAVWISKRHRTVKYLRACFRCVPLRGRWGNNFPQSLADSDKQHGGKRGGEWHLCHRQMEWQRVSDRAFITVRNCEVPQRPDKRKNWGFTWETEAFGFEIQRYILRVVWTV